MDIDLQSELIKITSSIQWDIQGLLHTNSTVSPLPAESRVITEILQDMIITRLEQWSKNKDIDMEPYHPTRSYPDITLNIKDNLIAIDIKSARYRSDDKISIMTLGTYNGYFLHPDKKILKNKTRCYNDYAEHWIISIIYKWNPTYSTSKMVEIIDICVGQKWQFAGKVSGSGDTANIGGIASLSRLQQQKSEFNNDEFETFWRNYSINHPRKRTRVPT